LIDFSNFHLGQKENILGLNECIEEAGLLDPSAQKIGNTSPSLSPMKKLGTSKFDLKPQKIQENIKLSLKKSSTKVNQGDASPAKVGLKPNMIFKIRAYLDDAVNG